MKFKEQSFTLFAYTNYRAIQGYHRLKIIDFKGKGAFHHFLVQEGLSMFFVEQPSHVETVCLLSRKVPYHLSGLAGFFEEDVPVFLARKNVDRK